MMEGGSDTTSGALLTFILAAVLYPEAIAKAHKELDAVIGSERYFNSLIPVFPH
jgi:hypothetical protein